MRTPPIAQVLHLDQRKLAAQVFERYAQRAQLYEERRKRAQLAIEQFGAPGRDPEQLGNVLQTLAGQSAWRPHLLLAQLNNHWDQVVGKQIAQYSRVDSYVDGVLTIRANSPVWVSQLTYLVPQIEQTIAKKLEDLPLEKVQITGPGVGRKRSRYIHSWR